ncbi:horcolin-like isoform X2 [Phragmites australis]|uniref:horcolin-like isoform X2 n=1 Tax=Phragmites australis TaxID=29695 RepID=UPI002D776C62|nr:horcolin-like isoform X2 [Phragmites australis]
MSSLVKVGTWGGDAGIPLDITVAPQRLESIKLRWGKVIDWIAFSYRDREKQLHTAGPWGGNGKGEGDEEIILDASEYVTEIAGTVGPIGDFTHTISSLKFVTNRANYGPFGRGAGTPFNVPVLNNGSIVGMFARAGDFLDAIGFYILPSESGDQPNRPTDDAAPVSQIQ